MNVNSEKLERPSNAINWLRSIPFLPSEKVRRVDKTSTGNICLTNYRLLFYSKHQSHTISIPIFLIRRVDLAVVHVNLITKIGTAFLCTFKSVSSSEYWASLLSSFIESTRDIRDMFAYSYRRELQEFHEFHPFLANLKTHLELQDSDNVFEVALVFHEFNRMEFNKDWKVTDVNSEFKICSSYPKYHIMPRDIKDSDIPSMAAFRSHNRFPSVVWRSKKTGAVLLRCAQPCVGIMYSRNELDEQFVKAVLANCRNDPKSKHKTEDPSRLLIIDARNYSVAQLNRLRGGGFEYIEYYEQSQIRFMDLPNLHSVRLSFEKLTQLYESKPDTNWYSSLEKTLWLYYISQLLKSASEIAAALDAHGRPVMVHCTDGWDRTPQLTSLAKILLDPYYRTIQGFKILIEHEWLQFGHKFGDRCGQGINLSSTEERSPIFLQWLDCVRQLHRQFPAYFEFNELFLIKLAMHAYSGLFGTFLCNSERERQTIQCTQVTCSLWAFLNPNHNWSLCNYLYEPKLEVIKPAWQVRSLDLWDSLYQNALLPCTALNKQLLTNLNDSEDCETIKTASLVDGLGFENKFEKPSDLLLSQPLEVIPTNNVSSGPATETGHAFLELNNVYSRTGDTFSNEVFPRSLSLSSLSTKPNPESFSKQAIETTCANRSTTPTLTGDQSFDSMNNRSIHRSFHLFGTHEKGRNHEVAKRLSRSISSLAYFSKTAVMNVHQLSNPEPVYLNRQLEESSQTKFLTPSATGHFAPRWLSKSNQDFSASQVFHTRSASDPPSAYHRLRLSSFVGEDLLLVDKFPVSRAMENDKSPNTQFFMSTDTEKPTADGGGICNGPVCVWSEDASASSESLSAKQCKSQSSEQPFNGSFCISREVEQFSSLVGGTQTIDKDYDALGSLITVSQSSSSCALKPWNQHYFRHPAFSDSCLQLNAQEHEYSLSTSNVNSRATNSHNQVPSASFDLSSCQHELLASSDTIHASISVRSPLENSTQQLSTDCVTVGGAKTVSPTPFHPSMIPRSRTVIGTAIRNATGDYHSIPRSLVSLRFGSPPENLDLFLNEEGSLSVDVREHKPLCSVWPSDWDGLPMRVDSITLRLHQKHRQEARFRQTQQVQIDNLASQVDRDKVEIAKLKTQVLQLQNLIESSIQLGHHHRVEIHDIQRNLPKQTSKDNQSGLCNGDPNSKDHLFSIEEALSDAMGLMPSTANPVRFDAVSSDDDLLELADEITEQSSNLQRQMLRIASREAVRSYSFSSDVSSFEMVDTKDMLGGPGSPAGELPGTTYTAMSICSFCALPITPSRPPHACGNCSRLFCSACTHLASITWDSQHQRHCRVCYACAHFLNPGQQSLLPLAKDEEDPFPMVIAPTPTPLLTATPPAAPKVRDGQMPLGLLAEVQDECPSASMCDQNLIGIHMRYGGCLNAADSVNVCRCPNLLPQKSSTPEDSPVATSKLGHRRCRAIEHCSSTSNGHGQNGVAKA